MLTITGQRHHEKNGPGRVERFSGSFVNSFRLPKQVDTQAIAANLENGCLIRVQGRQRNSSIIGDILRCHLPTSHG